MAEKRVQYEKITLPKGIAVWPKLTEPDEYKGKQTYNTGVLLPSAVAAPIMAKLTEAAEKFLEETRARLKEEMEAAKGAAKVKLKEKIGALALYVPFASEVDDEGEPTDGVIFKAKMNASYEDKKTKKRVNIKPLFYDASNPPQQVKNPPDIWGGSEIRVSALIVPTYVDASGVCGVSLRLRAVQLITVRSAGASAESLGFGAEEGGYQRSEDDDEAVPTNKKPAAKDEDADGEDEDF